MVKVHNYLMARPTYHLKGLVLKRTKLGETDVICTLLAEDGSQVRAVAKGARKPQSSFSSRLELGSVCNLLLVQGKTLDMIKEASLIESFSLMRQDLSKFEAVAPMLELLEKTTQPTLPVPRLFDLSFKSIKHVCDASDQLLKFCAAYLLKTQAFLGMRPQLTECLDCGKKINLFSLAPDTKLAFSLFDGGIVCSTCALKHETIWQDVSLLQWIYTLLYSSLDEIAAQSLSDQDVLFLIRFLQKWIQAHLNVKLKSLDFLFTSGISSV